MKESNRRLIPVIAGSGRSGTTWVVDAIAEANNLRTIFEPLHPECVKDAHKFSNLYIKNDIDPKTVSFFDDLVSGKISGIWIDYRVRTDRIMFRLKRFRSFRDLRGWQLRLKKLTKNYIKYKPSLKQPRIIKIIRGNLLLEWLVRNYPVKICFLVRHPGAVIESMTRLKGEDWDATQALSLYRSQERLLENFQPEIKANINGNLSNIEKHTYVWCLENVLPLRQAKKLDIYIFYYENLLQDPEKEWSHLVSALGLPMVPKIELTSKPSQQAAPGKIKKDYVRGRIGEWKKSFSAEDLTKMQYILDLFGIKNYSMNSECPQADL